MAPEAVEARKEPFGALINREYVFVSDEPQKYEQGGAMFSGTAGYARADQLALFEGDAIGIDGFLLRREGGNFGVSAELSGETVRGRIAGRAGGRVWVTLPGGFDAAKVRVAIGGKPVASTAASGAVSFAATISQADGFKSYEIEFGR